MLWCLYTESWCIVCLQLWALHAHDNSYRHHSNVPKQSLAFVKWKDALAFVEHCVCVQYRTMALPRNGTSRSASVAGSGHPIKAPASNVAHRFEACTLLCHTCVSCFKFFGQVLSRDLASTLSTLAKELNRSDGEDTLEEQTAVLLQLPRQLEDVCQLVEDGKDSPWNKLAFAEICDAIQHVSV